MNRYGSVNEISGAVLFLVSNLSNYMTGQSIIIDGGWLSSGGNSPA
jgi:NAD(P)-dependent dehydrogenase (short-subunit alcohol dehydrogenase family)